MTVDEQESVRVARRRFVLAGGAGVAAALVLFVLLLQGGRTGMFDQDLFGGFYDGQARALLDGRLDVDPDVPGIEGFRMGDQTHIYQGLTPALARVPLFVLTDRFDGRLTGLSMTVGLAVAGAYVVAAGWRIRRAIAGERRPGRLELVGTAVATFGLLTGPLLFLAATSWVYHESLMWGAALALASFTHLGIWMTDERRLSLGARGLGHLAAACVLAALALNTRSSVGGGPLAALGLLAVCLVVPRMWVQRVLGWTPRPEGASTRTARLAVVVVAVGLVAGVAFYAGVNRARFDSWFGVPLERQVLVGIIPERRALLEANDGSVFGPEFVPSVVLQTVRPDALGFRSHFPWISLPDERPAVIGDPVFVDLDWSSSVPSSSPLLAVAGLAGLIVLVVPRRIVGERADRLVAWRVPVLGAMAGALPFLAFGYIAHRYLVDLVPLLLLCSLVGLNVLAQRLVESGSALWSRLAVGGVALLTLWGAASSTAIALQYQQEISPRRTQAERAGWLQRQMDLGGEFRVRQVSSTEAVPPAEVVGDLLVVGDCEALYRSNGSSWRLLESSAPAGGWMLVVSRNGAMVEPVPLMVSDDGDAAAELLLEPLGGDAARLVVAVDRGGEVQRTIIGPTFQLADGARLDLRVAMDHRTDSVVVERADTGEELLGVEISLPDAAPEPAGDDVVSVSGTSMTTPLCRELTA